MIERIIDPRSADVGGLPVRRVLPIIGTRSIGPWVFFDHFGPAEYSPGAGVDVIPHPHINLATVTYLFEGEIVHRDSIESVQTITPGAINLMVAGRGIAHSERTSVEVRAAPHRVHGLQFWHALPEDSEEMEPEFHHTPVSRIPSERIEGATINVPMGTAFSLHSPVPTFSSIVLIDVLAPEGTELQLPGDWPELGIYAVSGDVQIDDIPVTAHRLAVMSPDHTSLIRAERDSRIIMLGGDPLGARYMWWNFVSSQKGRIEQAKADWKADRFGEIPGETERHPLPESDG